MAGRTQRALYEGIDLELSWPEEALPQKERTKHVHALHPYLGKFVPQLVEVFLRRLFRPGQAVYDPFCGSGTTLVEANVYGCHAAGCDVSAFNCLMTRVKTGSHRLGEVELALRGALEAARRAGPAPAGEAGEWARAWYADRALGELLAYRDAAAALDPDARDVAWLVLSRAARSARRTTHFDLDFPAAPVRGPTGATSTGAPAGRSRRRRSSSAATRTTRSPACARSPTPPRPAGRRPARRRAHGRAALAVRRRSSPHRRTRA